MSLKKKGSLSGRLCWVDSWRNWMFEASLEIWFKLDSIKGFWCVYYKKKCFTQTHNGGWSRLSEENQKITFVEYIHTNRLIIKIFNNLPVEDRLKIFRKASNQSYTSVIWRIGAFTLLRNRLNADKSPAGRKDGCWYTRTERFDQARHEQGSTITENNYCIRTISLQRIKTRKGT